MKFGVLGTGTVGRVIGSRLAELGHEVTIGTRDVDSLLARTRARRDGQRAVRVVEREAPGDRARNVRRMRRPPASSS